MAVSVWPKQFHQRFKRQEGAPPPVLREVAEESVLAFRRALGMTELFRDTDFRWIAKVEAEVLRAFHRKALAFALLSPAGTSRRRKVG